VPDSGSCCGAAWVRPDATSYDNGAFCLMARRSRLFAGMPVLPSLFVSVGAQVQSCSCLSSAV